MNYYVYLYNLKKTLFEYANQQTEIYKVTGLIKIYSHAAPRGLKTNIASLCNYGYRCYFANLRGQYRSWN